jgi:predicted acyltransferase (DUF342 family)
MPIFKKVTSIVERYDINTGMPLEIDKPYLLLMVPAGETEVTIGEFYAIKGRKAAYDELKQNFVTGNYNILASHVLSGGITFGNEVAVYTFFRLCIEKFKYGGEEDLELLNDMAVATSLDPDSVTDTMLNIHYTNELAGNPKGE